MSLFAISIHFAGNHLNFSPVKICVRPPNPIRSCNESTRSCKIFFY